MKVLMISRDPKVINQKSTVFLRMKEYAKTLHELHVLVLGKGEQLSDFSNENLYVYPIFSKKGIGAFFKALVKSSEIAKKINLDLITTQDPFEAGLIGFRLKKKFNIPLEVQIHADIFSPYFSRLSLRNWFQFKIAKRVLPFADHIRVVSERIKNSLHSTFYIPHSKIEIRPIAVDIEKIRNSPITEDLHKKYTKFKKIILMVGRLEKEKNYPLALRAFGVLRNKFPDIGLVIVGDGSINLKPEKNVMLEGWSDNVYSYMKTADLLLHTAWYEGYGIVFKEAEICGLSIISTDVGIASEVGATIIPFDYIEASKAIENKICVS